MSGQWDTPKQVAAALAGVPKPDGLEVTEHRELALQVSNTDIEQSESVLYPLTPEQMQEGHLTEERR